MTDFNPNLDYNHADDAEYKRLRDMAQKEYKRKAELSSQSQKAYQSGDGAEAKRLSEKSKEHAAKMDEYNAKAAEFVFRANNADSEADEIDLHGLFVREAIEYLEKRIGAALQRKESHLDVIVGKGLHSEHGAKIKPAVEEMCEKYKFKYSIDDDNSGVIIIDFSGSGGHVPLSKLSARPPKKSNKVNHKMHGSNYGGNNQGHNNYHQQQQSHSNNGGNNALLKKIFCGVFKFLLKKL